MIQVLLISLITWIQVDWELWDHGFPELQTSLEYSNYFPRMLSMGQVSVKKVIWSKLTAPNTVSYILFFFWTRNLINSVKVSQTCLLSDYPNHMMNILPSLRHVSGQDGSERKLRHRRRQVIRVWETLTSPYHDWQVRSSRIVESRASQSYD